MRRLLPILLALFVSLGVAVDTATARPAAAQVALTGLSRSSGSTVSAHTTTLTGAGLDRISGVFLGTTRLAVRSRSDSAITVVVPSPDRYQPATNAFAVEIDGQRRATRWSWTWRATSDVAKELQYFGRYIDARGTATYAYYPQNDCANFTSQALHARGLSLTASWSPGSAAWVSSTRLRSFLLGTGRVVELTNTAAGRAQVRVGDVIQFDWDRSGDRDHTGVVTRIDRLADGDVSIRYSAHTDARPPHDKNDPSWNLSTLRSKRNHQLVYDLPKTGKTYFLHFVS